MVKNKVMSKFKQTLLDALEDNRLELLMPSRPYNEIEITYMKGYQQALEDMLEDYNDDLIEEVQNTLAFSLN
jgi:hypothetical protein